MRATPLTPEFEGMGTPVAKESVVNAFFVHEYAKGVALSCVDVEIDLSREDLDKHSDQG